MTSVAVAQASLLTNLRRYSRSAGLWLLLLIGPVGARFMVARDNGSGVQIAIGNHLPVMTSAMLGISLGIVVSTLLLPVGFLYLRSNITRRQPWQIEEVTAASRIALMLGRFGADVAVLFAMLATLTLAGWLLGWLIVSGWLDVVQVTWCLWVVAAPAVMGLAAVHLLLDALPVTRRALGDTLFFVLWLTSIAMPAAVSGQPSSFKSNMYDFAGFVRPLVGGAPSKDHDFAIGSTTGILPGRVPLDVLAGVQAPGYLASRFAWAAIALVLVVIAGWLYRPHTAPKRSRTGILARLLAPRAPPAASATSTPARRSAIPIVGVIVAEFRLIGGGRLFNLLALAAAVSGLFGDYRHVGSPAALLLLIFGMAAHAGRSEGKSRALTHTIVVGAAARRIGFLVAIAGWAVLLALPGAIARLSPQPIILLSEAALLVAFIAMGLAIVSRSGFAPRLVLLVLWYGYLSS